MEEALIYESITAALTDKPKLVIKVGVQHRTIWDKILRRPKVREFKIYPCLAGNMYRVAGVAAKLPKEITGIKLESAVLDLINSHFSDIVYAVACLIQNNRKEPSKRLVAFIRDNFDSNDLYSCLYAGLANANMEVFLNSIVLMRGSAVILQPQTNP